MLSATVEFKSRRGSSILAHVYVAPPGFIPEDCVGTQARQLLWYNGVLVYPVVRLLSDPASSCHRLPILLQHGVRHWRGLSSAAYTAARARELAVPSARRALTTLHSSPPRSVRE